VSTREPLGRRPLGKTGIPVSPLGLAGGYGIDADSVERAFHELGVSYFFVTSKEDGVAEGVRRLVKAGHRDGIVIASGANLPTGFGVRRAWASEVKRLGVDHIDVFHLFWVQAHWYVTGKTWPEMDKLRDEGKVRALAISCHDRKLARRLVDELRLEVLMIRYNAAHRGAEDEIFATLPEPRPGIVAYTATRWGQLLRPHGQLSPMTASECYRFALGHPMVDLVLTGARSWGEVAENAAGVAQGPLPAPRADEVRRFGDAIRATARGRIGFGAT
jgi:aryl-alcohol dehydrogenase-like predicted oxidoreductase